MVLQQNNLDRLANYAKTNSYGDNKRQAEEQLAFVAKGDRENVWTPNGRNWEEKQRKEEHKGWADMKPTTAANTFTGKGGGHLARNPSCQQSLVSRLRMAPCRISPVQSIS